MEQDKALRDQLVALLRGGQAHTPFDQAIENFPAERAGERPAGLPHSAWELLEHLRITQWDILEFSAKPDHQSPQWPKGYWPSTPAPSGGASWDESVAAFRKDFETFIRLVQDPAQDLFRPFPWGEGQTLLREALLLADHNSYHVGQLVLVRRALGTWPE